MEYNSDEGLPNEIEWTPGLCKQLMEQFCSSPENNSDAWSDLWAQYGPHLTAYLAEQICRALRQEIDHSEMTRATIADVWRSYLSGLLQLGAGSTFITLVLRHSKRRFIDFYRRWRAEIDLESLVRELLKLLMSARAEQLQDKLSRRDVFQARRVLGLTQRRILDLRVRGYDWATIGDVVELPAKAACQRFCWALDEIRTLKDSTR
jgi:hypothetical protein